MYLKVAGIPAGRIGSQSFCERADGLLQVVGNHRGGAQSLHRILTLNCSHVKALEQVADLRIRVTRRSWRPRCGTVGGSLVVGTNGRRNVKQMIHGGKRREVKQSFDEFQGRSVLVNGGFKVSSFRVW